VAIALGAVLTPVATARLLQVLFDVATRRTITGEVLWTEPWPRTTLGRPLPSRSYLAVDDGSSDRTTAWALPGHLSCRTGDQVRITVRRWTRRVIDLSIIERSRQIAVGAAPNFTDLDPPNADQRPAGRHRDQ
jgi:hypothetical protein